MAEKEDKTEKDVFEKVSDDLIYVSGRALAKVWDPDQKKELISKTVQAVFIKKICLTNVTKGEPVEFLQVDIQLKDGTTHSINCNKKGANRRDD